jgi:hypothetical protein
MEVTLELSEDIAQVLPVEKTSLVQRWKAWHSKHTGPLFSQPLSFAG